MVNPNTFFCMSTKRYTLSRRRFVTGTFFSSNNINKNNWPWQIQLKNYACNGTSHFNTNHSFHQREHETLHAIKYQLRNFHYDNKINNSMTTDRIRIGSIEMNLKKTRDEIDSVFYNEIPKSYLMSNPPPTYVQHLQWLLSKDKLGQDMMLIGPPGSGTLYRRNLVLAYAELTQQPVEILTLTADITESDLKQKRDLTVSNIVNDDSSDINRSGTTSGTTSTITFTDQAPVRAAKAGKILILDGLEKAERNVLPTLNNLLEHREMHLEDGTFMISPRRFEELSIQNKSQSSSSSSSSSFLSPVHRDFRVIALCVPTPPYSSSGNSQDGVPRTKRKGRSLDPPIRSRFQIRRIDNPSSDELFSMLEKDRKYDNLISSTTLDSDSKNQMGELSNNSSKKLFTVSLASTMEDYHLSSLSSAKGRFNNFPGGIDLHFPWTSIQSLTHTLENFPYQNWQSIVARTYPLSSFNSTLEGIINEQSSSDTSTSIISSLDVGKSIAEYTIESIEPVAVSPGMSPKANVTFSHSSENASHTTTVTVPCGQSLDKKTSQSSNQTTTATPSFVHTEGTRKILSSMMQEHAAGKDMLLISPKGEGKTAIAKEFANCLGYRQLSLFAMYPEITAQDLLFRRSTDPITGSTTWYESPLLAAARSGGICVLDGIDKVRSDVLSSLQSLLVERESFSLPSGGRRIALLEDNESNENEDVIPIHPSFRVIALASSSAFAKVLSQSQCYDPLNHQEQQEQNEVAMSCVPYWMNSDVMTMFSTIALPSPSKECLRSILQQSASNFDGRISNSSSNNNNKERGGEDSSSVEVISSLLRLKYDLLTDSIAEDCGVAPLSTRNLIRVVRRVTSKDSDLYTALSSIFLLDLLPPSQRHILETVLHQAGIVKPKTTNDETDDTNDETTRISIEGSTLKIGNSFQMERKQNVSRPEMVPSPKTFFDIPCHVEIMEDMLQDFHIGNERAMLLLGNQGVGKNMIVDRICQVANWEREYIQLHRDSTIGQLTLTPSLEDGKIIWKDSPLVRAVRDGCVLVVDEADKAPVEVIAILKGLVEDGELLLADGRRIVKYDKNEGNEKYMDTHEENIIPIHPNFSIWLLANRPGYPFLGNDFFHEIGDCFSTRVIQNPDIESELRLLRSYAPKLAAASHRNNSNDDDDNDLIRSIATSFAELRQLSDAGDLSYPYSTREAVAVVKHLEEYYDYSSQHIDNSNSSSNKNFVIVQAIHNVLDFDSFDELTYGRIGEVFRRHGIPVMDYPSWKHAMIEYSKEEASASNLQIEYVSDNNDGGKYDDEKQSHSPPNSHLPKHGKWDEKNEIHVGGNQWAGGTGGSDTAGLGGRGGPYRLDRGHTVHQVSDEAKQQVSEHAKMVANEMRQMALQQRLNEIGMSENEWSMYQNFIKSIQTDISRLRDILNYIRDKSSEEEEEEESAIMKKQRGWLKRQSYGEIDDTRLIDGITGDKYIYKRRGVMNNNDSSPFHNDDDDDNDDDNDLKQKVTRIRFVLDCSGSMYRFNGYDQRLIRCLETALLIMESFDYVDEDDDNPTERNNSNKHNGRRGRGRRRRRRRFEYSIVGHSGDSSCIPFVDFDDNDNYDNNTNNVPTNELERMRILQQMLAHSQYCQSGDFTLQAMDRAIHDIKGNDGGSKHRQKQGQQQQDVEEDYLVIGISDANLARYGIHPAELGKIIQNGDTYHNVKAHCIFIASFDDEADTIRQSLPLGRGHICHQTTDLPRILRNILTAKLLLQNNKRRRG